jgi:hypothetical protein
MPGDEDNRLCVRTPYVKKSLYASINWKPNILYTPTPNGIFRLLLELWDDDLIKDGSSAIQNVKKQFLYRF